jgi:hypothetical protein
MKGLHMIINIKEAVATISTQCSFSVFFYLPLSSL